MSVELIFMNDHFAMYFSRPTYLPFTACRQECIIKIIQSALTKIMSVSVSQKKVYFWVKTGKREGSLLFTLNMTDTQ